MGEPEPVSVVGEEIAIAVLKVLVVAIPTFATWLGELLAGEAEPGPFSRRVLDILPKRSASRDAADAIGRGD